MSWAQYTNGPQIRVELIAQGRLAPDMGKLPASPHYPVRDLRPCARTGYARRLTRDELYRLGYVHAALRDFTDLAH